MWWLLLALTVADAAPERSNDWALQQSQAWFILLRQQGPEAALEQAHIDVDQQEGLARALLLGELGAVQATIGALLEARQTLDSALSLAREHGGSDAEVAHIRLRRGMLALQLEQPGYVEDLEHAQQWLPHDATDLRFRALYYLTVGAVEEGDYAAAADLHARLGRLLGPEPQFDQQRAQWLLQKSMITHGLGDYRQARSDMEATLDFLAEAGEEVDPLLYGVAQHQAGAQSYEQGDYERSVLHMRETLRIRQQVQGPDHIETLQAMFDLGILTQEVEDDFIGARTLMQEAHSRQVAQFGTDHPLVLGNQINLALLYTAASEMDEAKTLMESACATMERVYPPEDARRLHCQRDLALIYFHSGALAEAHALIERTLSQLEALYGPEHPELAVTLNTAASVASTSEQSLAYITRGLDIYTKTLGADSPKTQAFSLAAAQHALSAGDLDATEALLEKASVHEQGRALAKWRSAYWIAMGRLHRAQNRPDQARDAWKKAYRIAQSDIAPRVALGSDRDRLSAYDALGEVMGYLLAGPEQADENWRYALAFKGGADRALATRRRVLRTAREDESLTDLLAAWRRAASQLSGVAWSTDARPEDIRRLASDVEELEYELARQLPIAAADRLDDLPTLETLCSALPDDAVLLDLYTVARDPEGQRQVSAFVLRGKTCEQGPLQVNLGADEALEEAVTSWQYALSAPDAFTTQVDGRGHRASEMLLDPLAPHLEEAEEVWVVADSYLALVPWGALPVEVGPGRSRYLLEDKLVRYFDSALDILAREQAPPSLDNALLLGAPTFGGAPEQADATRSAAPGCARRDFGPLPQTLEEVKETADLLDRRTGAQVAVLTGDEAREHNVTAALVNQDLVHLATHGFFAQNDCKNALDGERSTMDTVAGYSPLVLSGLALSGANKSFDPLAPEDGMWTAEEVAGLELDDAELVVLSACETGLGTTSAGQGVQGLRRAFRVAGAQRLVMTLWTVDDADAAQTVSAFYRRWLHPRRGGDVADALRKVKLERLRANRARYGEARPYQWAGWLAVE